MANIDTGQFFTIASGLPVSAPVIITAGSLLALLQAAGATPIPWYATAQDQGLPPTDLTQLPGF